MMRFVMSVLVLLCIETETTATYTSLFVGSVKWV